MAEGTFLQSANNFDSMPRRCRGTLNLQIITAQKLLNEYQVIQDQDDCRIECPYNSRQYLNKIKKHTQTLRMHINKIYSCLEQLERQEHSEAVISIA